MKQILAQWPEILRLASSIRIGTVTSSLILRKLASYPRQNGLAVALREFGRIERTLFTLDWLLDKNLRQRVTAGLNKGELKNTLAKAVCFNRLGELRDRSFEAQHHRASGLNIVVATIILWNTVYLELAIGSLRQQGRQIDDGLLKHVAPVHWNHINLTGVLLVAAKQTTAGWNQIPDGLTTYDASTARSRHMALVRSYLGVTSFADSARKLMLRICLAGSRVREDLADIVNMAIEELIRQRYELPGFSTLFRAARAARVAVNRGYYRQIYQAERPGCPRSH